MRNFSTLLVAVVGFSSNFATAATISSTSTVTGLIPVTTVTRTYEYQAPEEISIYNSQVTDPVYRSVLGDLASASGAQGAAWTSVMSALAPLSTADASGAAAAFSEIDRLITLLPTAYQSYQASINSQFNAIRATWVASTWTTTFVIFAAPQTSSVQSPSFTGTHAGGTLSEVYPSTTIIFPAGSSLLSSISAASKAAATSTGAAEKMVVMGYAAAMGAVGAAAVLL